MYIHKKVVCINFNIRLCVYMQKQKSSNLGRPGPTPSLASNMHLATAVSDASIDRADAMRPANLSHHLAQLHSTPWSYSLGPEDEKLALLPRPYSSPMLPPTALCPMRPPHNPSHTLHAPMPSILSMLFMPIAHTQPHNKSTISEQCLLAVETFNAQVDLLIAGTRWHHCALALWHQRHGTLK